MVALAGGTGSGKSSLFNRLAGEQLAPAGVRRPTTSRARAAIPPGAGGDVSALLDWLDVRDRHVIGSGDAGSGLPAGLILIDLPDYDSTHAEHRAEAERLAGVVDVLIWVTDPQKYADAALHERYLRGLAGHRDVMVVVLNQVDRLGGVRADAAETCRRDLAHLLADDGLSGVPLHLLSARTGDGVAELRERLERQAGQRNAAVQRLHADLDAVAGGLATLASASPRRRSRGAGQEVDLLVAALERASGAAAVADAAAASYRRSGLAAVGWPPTRWLVRRRPDPLRRIVGRVGGPGTDMTGPGGTADAVIANAVRDLVAARSDGLAEPWQRGLRTAVQPGLAALPGDLALVMQGAQSEAAPARWWRTMRGMQAVLLGIAVAGAVWLVVLAVLAYFRLPNPTPHIGPAPVPTVLLVGGVVAGLLLALAARPVLAAGARRRRGRVLRQVRGDLERLAHDRLIAPLDAEQSTAEQFRTALDACLRS